MPDAFASSIFLDTAAAIGGRLCRDAVWDGDRCTWVGESLEPVGSQWLPVQRGLGAGLYEGTAGVGLFLAHLHAATGDAPFRTAARGALAHAVSRRDTVHPPTRVALHTGLSGIAWALASAGEALGDGGMREEAERLAAELAGVPPHPEAVDVISGSAGAIPAMLALAAATGVEALVETAVRHGDFLLAQAVRTERGWGWHSPGIPASAPLCGYSHGASGIAHALLELGHATGEARFRQAALEGFAYERAFFDPQVGNWPDLRRVEAPKESPGYGVAWCHGAPGIGLARLRAMALAPDETLAAEANAAVQTTARTLQNSIDAPGNGFSLCHGHAGNAEVLIAAHALTGAPEHLEFAREVGRRGIALYERPALPWPSGVPGGESPGLMLGEAGIGSFYLRLHDPAAAPSVLLVTADSLAPAAALA